MEQYPDRSHPNRLSNDLYSQTDTPIFVTIDTKSRQAFFTGEICEIAVQVIRQQTRRWRLALHAYCIMPDHIHLVCSAESPDAEFRKCMSGIKRQITRRARQNGEPDFEWQRSYWDKHARAEDDVREMITYVLENPVRAGLCNDRDDWAWGAFCGWPSVDDET